MMNFYSLLINDKADFTEDEYITEIMSLLPPSHEYLESTRRFILPYINHNPEDVIITRKRFLEYVGEYLNTDYYKNIDLNYFENRQTILESFNIDSDYCNPGFFTIWRRFAYMDDEFREWSFTPVNSDVDLINSTCLNDVDDTIKLFFRVIDRENKLNKILK